jgi:hypothetical protein
MEVQDDPRFQVNVEFNFEPSQKERDKVTDTILKAIQEVVGDIPKGCIFVHYVPGRVARDL